YLVWVCSSWQAKCALSRLSCRGALAVASKACIFTFILSRCARRGKQSVHYRVYLVAVRPPWQAKRVFLRLSCRGAPAVASKACSIGSLVASLHVYLLSVRASWQPKRVFSRLSCRVALVVASKVCIFAFILSRCARRGKQSVHFIVYLVAVRSPRQAKCALSLLSCRSALAVASKACIFSFILSRCARRGKQSVHFSVYLVAVCSPWQAKRAF